MTEKVKSMANDAYTKALREVLTNDSPPAPTSRTRAEIEMAIQSITDQLRGPLANVERLLLVDERRELRKQFETVKKKESHV